ncbi:hypothetical protein Tco_0868615 [Tanacetum coccineum]
MASMNTRLNIEKLGVHGVHDKKRVWFEVELQGAQGDRKAEVFQVSNNVTAVAQRRLKDKQPEEKINTDCLRSTQQCTKSGVAKHLGVVVIQQQNGLVKETNMTLLNKGTRSPSSPIGFKTPRDMLGFFGWLASKRQGMLELVVLYRNMGFNESGEYKKTFIGSGVGTSSVQVLQGVEFEVEPQDDHTFEVEPHGNVDHVVGSQEVQTQDLIYYHPVRDREQHLAWELFSYKEDNNEATFAVAAVENIYAHESLTFNNTVASMVARNAVTTFMAITESIHQAEILAIKGLLDKAKGNILGMEIVRDQNRRTGFVDSDYVMGRSITRYGFMIQRCAGSLKAMMLYMMALSPTEAGYMTLTEAAKEAIWLKGLAIESGFELKMVAGIATGALSKAIPSPRFPDCWSIFQQVVSRAWSRVLGSLGSISKVLLIGFSLKKKTVKVLEFFDCPGPRQGVEDLRELLHKVWAGHLSGNRLLLFESWNN